MLCTFLWLWFHSETRKLDINGTFKINYRCQVFWSYIFKYKSALTQLSSDTTYIDVVFEFVNVATDDELGVAFSDAEYLTANSAETAHSQHNRPVVEIISNPTTRNVELVLDRFECVGEHLPECEGGAIILIICFDTAGRIRIGYSQFCSDFIILFSRCDRNPENEYQKELWTGVKHCTFKTIKFSSTYCTFVRRIDTEIIRYTYQKSWI